MAPWAPPWSAVADDGEEDVLEGRLLLDVFDLGRREQLLELGEGAVHADPTLVKDRDPVGELFGLVEVLRREQHRRPLLGELLDGLPHLDAPLRVEPVRRLVEEDDRWIPDEAHRDVETATHAARIGRHPPLGRVGQPEAIEQVIRDRAGVLEVPQAGDQHEVLPATEDLVDGRELAREAERLPDVRSLRGDIEAVDDGRPRVGPEQVDRILTTVVLPAPFEPSRAKMLPRATSKSTPRRTCSSLYDFSRPCTWTAGPWTGVVVIWLSPFLLSPYAYDVDPMPAV